MLFVQLGNHGTLCFLYKVRSVFISHIQPSESHLQSEQMWRTSLLQCCQGRLIFLAFFYATVPSFPCCLDCTWIYRLFFLGLWLVHSAGSILWGWRCILGTAHLVFVVCPIRLMLDFIQTPHLTVAGLFSFPSSSCSCWKILRCDTIVIIVRFKCCSLWIYMTNPHHSYMPVIRQVWLIVCSLAF